MIGMKVLLQTESAECGLACLAMVLRHHGQQVEIAELRRKHAVSLKGMALKDLLKIASDQGLSARPVRLEIDELSKLSLPCVLHWDMNHFVVLEKISDSKAILLDPAIGRRKLSLNEVSRHFTGVAVELKPVCCRRLRCWRRCCPRS